MKLRWVAVAAATAVLLSSCVTPALDRGAFVQNQVTGLVHGRQRPGAELGYTFGAERGPLLIASSFRAWHRSDRSTPIADVSHIDWGEPAVFLSPGARMTHPQAR